VFGAFKRKEGQSRELKEREKEFLLGKLILLGS